LVFSPGYQQRLVECLKKKNVSWANIAENIGISEYTLRVSWRHGKSTLPLSYARKIASASSTNWDDVINNVMIVPEKIGAKNRKVALV
jgi:cyanate lyase